MVLKCQPIEIELLASISQKYQFNINSFTKLLKFDTYTLFERLARAITWLQARKRGELSEIKIGLRQFKQNISKLRRKKYLNKTTRKKNLYTLEMQLRFRVIGQKHAKWLTFEKFKNNRLTYGSQSHPSLTVILFFYIWLLFWGFPNICHFVCVCVCNVKTTELMKGNDGQHLLMSAIVRAVTRGNYGNI